MKKYFTIYKTEILNLKTGIKKYYYGRHITNNINDSYVGSGNYIERVKVSNDHILSKTVLEVFDNYDKMVQAEILYIMAGKLKYGKNCVNLSYGGEGGKVADETRIKCKKHSINLWKNPNHIQHMKKKMKEVTSTPEAKLNTSIKTSQRYKDPVFVRKVSNIIKKKLSNPAVKEKHINGIKAAKRSHLTIWQYEDELFELWKKTKCGWRKFTKEAIKHGYPNEPYRSMVSTFQKRHLEES